jgi:NAD(P)-dependent dehydrogenase (short-subunit alcohol dehydrogenase family)
VIGPNEQISDLEFAYFCNSPERNTSATGHRRYPRAVATTWTPSRLGDLTGTRIIVTGATNGVGLATARALTRAGAHVVLAVRNLELGAQRAAEMGGDTTVVKLDLADLSTVRAFPDLLDGDVDVLINNAGLVADQRRDTVDGFEISLGTNFLGPFALTNLLLPRVRSKIITVGSDAHRMTTFNFDDPHLRRSKWSAFPAYARSKLAVMLWGLELDRRLREAGSPVSSFLTHPGWVASNLSNVSDTVLLSAAHAVVRAAANLLANDIDAGAAPTLYCLTEPIPPGSYVGIDSRLGLKGGPTLSGRAATACDYDDARRLWEFAEKETGTSFPL